MSTRKEAVNSVQRQCVIPQSTSVTQQSASCGDEWPAKGSFATQPASTKGVTKEETDGHLEGGTRRELGTGWPLHLVSVA